jgi:two-component system NtrC family sensor kinase
MIKIFFLSVAFSFSGICCLAQSKQADSLKTILEKNTARDTIRVQNLCNYSATLINTDINKAIWYGKQGVELAKELKWYSGLSQGLIFLSEMYSYSNKSDSAILSALEALKVSEEANNPFLLAHAHTSLSENYRSIGNNNLAEYHGKKYNDLAVQLKNDWLILDAMVKLCIIYEQMGQTGKMQGLLEKALKMAEALKSEGNLARILEIKASRLFTLKDYEGAVLNYRQVLTVWAKKKNYTGVAWIEANLSWVFSKLKNKDSAGYYAYAAFETSTRHGLRKELEDAYNALFTYHYTFGAYKKALEYRLIYDSLYNNTYNTDMAQSIERVRMEYDQKKKDVQAQSEQARKDTKAQRTRNIQYAIISACILLAVFLFWNNRQKQKAKTKIEQAYSDLKSAQQQLVQSEKMASLGELTAGIAHEIQNPLNFVNNFSEVSRELLDEMKEEIAARNYTEVEALAADIDSNLEKINHHGKRADAIVKGMLQHSRSSSGVKEPTDINMLADEYLRLAYHGLRAKDKSFNATLKTEYSDVIGHFNVIPQDIGRVILNLITNAFYAVEEKKKHNSGLEESYDPTVSVTTKRVNDFVEIVVADNGGGIPQHVIGKIFNPFFTTKPTGEGTGLGLSLSYDIIKAHGGELTVETRTIETTSTVRPEITGTTFTIRLPYSE